MDRKKKQFVRVWEEEEEKLLEQIYQLQNKCWKTDIMLILMITNKQISFPAKPTEFSFMIKKVEKIHQGGNVKNKVILYAKD